ncbi:MAG: SRPBCC family protein [Acidimicrobiia bacterium]|nr:SRPBCC family protein [Acidimicrobiia bacterium]
MASFTLERTRVLDAPPDRVWDVVSDVGRYYEVVENLVATDVVSGSGLGMARHCVDDKGREWDESCTLWEPGRRYRMTVDVDTYPASFAPSSAVSKEPGS